MRDRLDELGSGTDVVLITFTTTDLAQRYEQRVGLPFPILLDDDRGTYTAYGLGRGTVRRVWGWRAARRYWDILRRDGLSELRKPSEDTLQLGGDFVIAPDGTLAYGFWGEGPDDRPSVDTLIDAVARAAAE